MTDAMQVKEALQQRHDEISKWLGDNAPYVVADQKHLDENTPERAYWHYGYKAALADVLALAPSAAALDPVTVVLRKALKEIEQLGENSLGGSNACRMGNIAHAALIEARLVTSTDRVQVFEQCPQCWQPATCKKYGCRAGSSKSQTKEE
jgi:hypothetical protein